MASEKVFGMVRVYVENEVEGVVVVDVFAPQQRIVGTAVLSGQGSGRCPC